LSFFATLYCLNPPKQSAENKDFGFCFIICNFDANLQKNYLSFKINILWNIIWIRADFRPCRQCSTINTKGVIKSLTCWFLSIIFGTKELFKFRQLANNLV